MVAISLLYPLLVFLLTWGLFVLFAVTMAWRFLDFMSDLPSQGPLVLVGKAVLTQIVGWQQTASIWGPAVPAVVVIAAGLWYFFSARATMIEPRATGLFLGWLPWTGRMLRSLRTAAMADILGMLVEHGVPLNTAVVMASEAMGGPRTARAAQGLAEALRRGEPLDRNVELISAFPPAVTWAIVAGDRQRSLATALRHVAEIYHQRAQYQGEAARVFVPILLTLAIGGTVAVVYALLILGTWFSVLRALA